MGSFRIRMSHTHQYLECKAERTRVHFELTAADACFEVAIRGRAFAAINIACSSYDWARVFVPDLGQMSGHSG